MIHRVDWDECVFGCLQEKIGFPALGTSDSSQELRGGMSVGVNMIHSICYTMRTTLTYYVHCRCNRRSRVVVA